MKEILARLFKGETLSKPESTEVLTGIATGRYNNSQIASFLTVLSMRPVTPDELSGFREAMLSLALPLNLTEFNPIDLCGTGGDGRSTFNISTTAAFVVAGAGVPVAKHGNYSASSSFGSSNLLESLKVPFAKDESAARTMLSKAGICFLHAPHWHPAMKGVAPVRKELGFRTIFNLLGPLVNPAKPTRQLVGVFSGEILKLYHSVLSRSVLSRQSTQYAVVYTEPGYDEVSLTGETQLAESSGIRVVTPADFNLSPVKEEELTTSNSSPSTICLKVLRNEGTKAQTEVVIANAALAIAVARSISILEAVNVARDSLRSGRALTPLTTLQSMATEL